MENVVIVKEEKMMTSSQIKPSKSQCTAPVDVVRKEHGTLWLCIDLWLLIEATKKDAYPLPHFDECLDAL